MPDPLWPSSPPEVNHMRLVGPGAAGVATTTASCAVWQALMVSDEVAFSVSTLNTAVTAADFEGVGGLSSATTVTGLNAALQMLAGWVQEKPPVAASAVSAYQTAVSSMIPAEVAIANRTEQAANVALNPLVLGALTPAIVALDAAYFGEFWPHNAGVGIAYGAALAALSAALAVPPPLSSLGASPAAPAAAAAAVAQTAGQAAAGEAMQQSVQAGNLTGDGTGVPAAAAAQFGQAASMISQPLQAMSAAEPVTGMFQAPGQALGGLAGLPKLLDGTPVTGGLDNWEDDSYIPSALPGTPGMSSLGGAAGIAPAPGAGGGPVAGVGGVPGPGLTTYHRPASSFAPETGGRPAPLKTGLLSAAEFHGPTGLGTPLPVAAAHPGMQAPSRSPGDREGVTQARVLIGRGAPGENRSS